MLRSARDAEEICLWDKVRGIGLISRTIAVAFHTVLKFIPSGRGEQLLDSEKFSFA